MLVKPTKVNLGAEGNTELKNYVREKIRGLKDSFADLHTSKVAKWRRLYRGVPKEKERNFPWKNASNVVIQLIGENVDTIRARVLGTIYEIMPLFTTGLIGDWPKEENAGGQQEVTHAFLNYVGLEPSELDLYRVESALFDEIIKFGTSMVKFPWIHLTEAKVIGETGTAVDLEEFTLYDGPRPEKLEFERWAATPEANTLEEADFKYHEIRLTKQQLEERLYQGVYDVDSSTKAKLLACPDSNGPDSKQQTKEADNNAKEPYGKYNAKWSIHECWFPYFHNGRKLRIIYSYHVATNTKLRAIFNFYPNNEEPFELGRFGWQGDGLLGTGYCELLEHYQEEVCTSHNQRVDNGTLQNTSILRVDPNSKLDTIFSIYPNALIPAAQGEIEKFQLGSTGVDNLASEQWAYQLAKARAGTDEPGSSGAGVGGMGKGKQGYSSMGTFSVMQAGNRRTNLNITDMRYLHLKIGRKLLNQYAHFGVGLRLQQFGESAPLLRKALENVKANKLVLPIRAATASINKEVEKQNLMLLTQVQQRHQMGVSQMIQAVSNPTIPPEMKQYLIGCIEAQMVLMTTLYRDFGVDDTGRMTPEKKLIEGANNGQSNRATPQGSPSGSPEGQGGNNPVVQGGGASPQPVQGPSNPAPVAGVQ